jgi:hypothetical protein
MSACAECKRPTSNASHKLCAICYAIRKQCGNCEMRKAAKGDYEYCYQHRCATTNCKHARMLDGSGAYCTDCVRNWDVICYVCAKNKTQIPFQTCTDCNAKRKACDQCQTRKVKYDKMNETFYDFCSECICKTNLCCNKASAKSDFCDACEKCR